MPALCGLSTSTIEVSRSRPGASAGTSSIARGPARCRPPERGCTAAGCLALRVTVDPGDLADLAGLHSREQQQLTDAVRHGERDAGTRPPRRPSSRPPVQRRTVRSPSASAREVEPLDLTGRRPGRRGTHRHPGRRRARRPCVRRSCTVICSAGGHNGVLRLRVPTPGRRPRPRSHAAIAARGGAAPRQRGGELIDVLRTAEHAQQVARQRRSVPARRQRTAGVGRSAG